jgi:hypothetical protein
MNKKSASLGAGWWRNLPSKASKASARPALAHLDVIY